MSTNHQPAMLRNSIGSIAANTQEIDASLNATIVESTPAIVEAREIANSNTVTTTVPATTLKSLLADASDLTAEALALVSKLVNNSLAALNDSADELLVKTISAHKTTLIALAESWLTLGAEALYIWGERLLFCWPESFELTLEMGVSTLSTHDVQLPVKEQAPARMSIVGLNTLPAPIVMARLAAEAGLIADLTSLTSDLDKARAELLTRERIKTEMEGAANIQLQLLPQTFPAIKGLDMYAHSLPATQVGGDFYSFHVREDRPFTFAVGDVSGKGLPAAFLMAMTRIVLQGAARFMPTIHPRAILGRLNEDLYDDFTDLGMFATVFVGCYDATNHNLTYANAGHSPVIYCPAGGSATMLEADGPAVGVLSIDLCENMTMPFQPGDVLVAATDGFCEAMNASGEMFGYESLLKAVEELAHLPAADIAEELYKRIHLFSSGEEQSDVQTLIIIKGDNL